MYVADIVGLICFRLRQNSAKLLVMSIEKFRPLRYYGKDARAHPVTLTTCSTQCGGNKDYWRKSYKKILLQSIYFKMSCLIYLFFYLPYTMSNSPCVIDCKQLFIPIHSIPAKQKGRWCYYSHHSMPCHYFWNHTLSNNCDVSDCVE